MFSLKPLKNIPRNFLFKRSFNLSTSRYFSSNEDDSHNDFKPIKKNIPEGLEEVLKVIDQQVKENSVILYMKGTPSKPQCGFSAQAVRILYATGVEFSSVNVLEYPAIREAIKSYSDWPTIPQLFIKGEFIGGCDILTSMYQEGELQKMLKDLKLIDPSQV
mmetsp:Transcript_2150/g.2112  ORF Transcript_2150/g.2112 Transcript_2150/m.2112 type:complete len:161 (+) Transcript_2150:58-540(+)